MNRDYIAYNLYKKWFRSNLIIFGIAIIAFIVCVVAKADPAILLTSLMFVLVTIGWGLTAFIGMKSSKKRGNEYERNCESSIS